MEEAVNVKHLVFSGLQVPLLVPAQNWQPCGPWKSV